MKIIKAIKQFKEVMELQEENEILYADKVYYQTELEEKDKQYEITKKDVSNITSFLMQSKKKQTRIKMVVLLICKTK